MASVRVAEAGLRNVTFKQSDVSQLSSDKPFDAVVDRFILQFLVVNELTHRVFMRRWRSS